MTLKQLFEDIKDNQSIHAILAGTLLNGVVLGETGNKVNENTLNLAKKELSKVINKFIQKAYEQGRKDTKEEMVEFMMKNLYNEQTCEKINEFLNKK